MKTTVTLPELGAAGPITLSVWYALPGDLVLQGERLVEVLHRRVTMLLVRRQQAEPDARVRCVLAAGDAELTVDADGEGLHRRSRHS